MLRDSTLNYEKTAKDNWIAQKFSMKDGGPNKLIEKEKYKEKNQTNNSIISRLGEIRKSTALKKQKQDTINKKFREQKRGLRN